MVNTSLEFKGKLELKTDLGSPGGWNSVPCYVLLCLSSLLVTELVIINGDYLFPHSVVNPGKMETVACSLL